MRRRRPDDNVVPFKRRKTWTKPEDYGRVLPTSTWSGSDGASWGAAWRATRVWILLIALCTTWYVYDQAGAFDPPAFLEGEPVQVSGDFTRCGPGRGALCVIDGDTFKIPGREGGKLDERKVRLVGIDAPEVKALCPAEAAAAERATAALQRWLTAAPFELVARLDQPTDKWGRDLMTARRTSNGRSETAAEALLAQGVVRAYAGEARQSWC